MTNKNDWDMKDITKIFEEHQEDVKKKIMLYTGENWPDGENDKKKDRNKKILERLYKKGEYKKSVVNFINKFLETSDEDGEDYNCEVFFNDKPIVIYKSEIDALNKIKKRYMTNEKDGRRVVRLVCLLLAWQKAYQNQFINHRFKPFAMARLDELLENNPIVDRSDSVAMIADRKKLKEDGYIQCLLPQVAEPREDMPNFYYNLSFCVDASQADNEEIALEITDFRNIWEQIFVAAFKEFDILEDPKEKDIKQGIIKEYDKKSKDGKVYIPDKDKTYSFCESGRFNVEDQVNVHITDSKKGKIKILKKPNERVYITYKAVKRCQNCGKVFYAKQMGDGTGNCDICNRR